MITPPMETPCFYTVLFEKQVSQELMKLMAPTKGGDIEQVLFTSINLGSDVMAAAELEHGVSAVVKGSGIVTDRLLTFNPLYLPMKPDELAEKLEVNNDGDIQSVAGFANPFITIQLRHSTELCPDVVDGKICFQQFPLPSFTDIFETQQLIS